MKLEVGDCEVEVESLEYEYIGEKNTMEHDTYILEEAAEIVYDRPDSHGSPEDSFQLIADFWTVYFGVPVSSEDVAYAMILLKIARSMNGHYTDDNPKDIAGYAENIGRLNSPQAMVEAAQEDTVRYCDRCDREVDFSEVSQPDPTCPHCGKNPFPPIA